MQMMFCVVMQNGLACRHQSFGGTYFLHRWVEERDGIFYPTLGPTYKSKRCCNPEEDEHRHTTKLSFMINFEMRFSWKRGPRLVLM